MQDDDILQTKINLNSYTINVEWNNLRLLTTFLLVYMLLKSAKFINQVSVLVLLRQVAGNLFQIHAYNNFFVFSPVKVRKLHYAVTVTFDSSYFGIPHAKQIDSQSEICFHVSWPKTLDVR